MIPSFKQYDLLAEKLGYQVFREDKGKPFNLNIVGWRNKKARPNYFDDFISVYHEDHGEWIDNTFLATTLPGNPSLLKPRNVKGAAILKTGQYLKSHSLGVYKSAAALRQSAPVTVYRDNNLDSKFDYSNPERGYFGIHIHRAGLWSQLVGPYSAGCQVIQRRDHFDRFIRLCELSETYWGPLFTYTLVDF